MFSANKRRYEGTEEQLAKCDALSWFLSTKEDDKSYSFMTNMYYTYPDDLVKHSELMAQVGQSYKIECEIRYKSAKYWVDGNLFAECTYQLNRVPYKGYFGFARYNLGERKLVSAMKITYLESYETRRLGKLWRKNYALKKKE